MDKLYDLICNTRGIPTDEFVSAEVVKNNEDIKYFLSTLNEKDKTRFKHFIASFKSYYNSRWEEECKIYLGIGLQLGIELNEFDKSLEEILYNIKN